ncbi:MAG: NAD(P)H-dependent oxidoreductase, partial [Firmicutes bacterium]|nr:NAD(P)H-dependent oxidoreductase [Bacillota bacterium]
MILMLNCSYKGKRGNTQYYLELLKAELGDVPVELWNIHQVMTGGLEALKAKLDEAEAFVIGAPLYVDGLPAQMVKILEELLEKDQDRYLGKPVYVISNLGFYEGTQICHLMDIVRNWCGRMGMVYGGGVAVGAGPLVHALKNMPLKKGPNREIGLGLERLAKAMKEGGSVENMFAQTKIPRFI